MTGINKPNILEACLITGQRLAKSNFIYLSKLIGLGIQENIYQKFNDDKQKMLITQAKNDLEATHELSNRAIMLIIRNKQLTSKWLQELNKNGEIKANEYAISEAIRISNDPDINPCKRVR